MPTLIIIDISKMKTNRSNSCNIKSTAKELQNHNNLSHKLLMCPVPYL